MRMPWTQKEDRAEISAVAAPLMAQKGVSFITAGSESYSGARGIIYGRATSTDRQNNSIVMACCLWAGRNIQQAPVSTYQEVSGGTWEIIPGHAASELIRRPQKNFVPGERTKFTGRQLLSSILISAMLTGDAYVMKIRNNRGQIIGFDYIPAHAITIRTRANDSRMVEYYEVNQAMGTVKVMPEDMITFPLFGLDDDRPYKGRDVLKAAAAQIVTDNKVSQYSGAIMDKPTPSMMVAAKGARQPQQQDADRLQKEMSESLGGRNAGRVLVTTFEADVTPFGFSPDQMAVTTISEASEARVCAIYGIPPTVLQLGAGMKSSTYNNVKETREAATEEFLVPMWDAIAEIWTDNVLSEVDPKPGLEIRYNKTEVRALQEDRTEVHDRSRADFQANGINRAEYRQAIGKEPQPGDDKVYAHMLKPTMTPDMPQGPKAAREARQAAENG